jgi:hypothetical protein
MVRMQIYISATPDLSSNTGVAELNERVINPLPAFYI